MKIKKDKIMTKISEKNINLFLFNDCKSLTFAYKNEHYIFKNFKDLEKTKQIVDLCYKYSKKYHENRL